MLTRDADLRSLNTLRLPARAELLAQPASEAELVDLLRNPACRALPRTVLGEGSNLVLCGDLPGLVIRPSFRGIRVLAEAKDQVTIEAGAGENWDALVAHSLDRGWQGLENLSLIPGSVGAAPYQNIGAYGVELADHFAGLTAIHLRTGLERTFSLDDCRFAYRDSFFKSVEPGQWLICRVRLRLNLRPQLQLGYADLQVRFQGLPPAERDARGVRGIVCALRRSKLPDPAVLPNAGSFFKNPVVSASLCQALKARFPDLVAFELPNGDRKLAAGWLIEKAGWKGRREGSLGMHSQQALVLVNHGDASGEEVLRFAARVAADVEAQFGVRLEREPVRLPA